jgi:hypothetical protein
MSNTKVQSSKECQSLKLKKSKFIKEDSFDIKLFVIDVTFACLREAAPAKAGILTFGLRIADVFLPMRSIADG